MSYYRARYYDPTTGRFLSDDPKRFSEGANFYAYVKNRVTVINDPSGLGRPLTSQEWESIQQLFPGSQIVDGQLVIPESYTLQQVVDTLKDNGFPYQSQTLIDFTWNPKDHLGEYECRAKHGGLHLTLPKPVDFCSFETGYCHLNPRHPGAIIASQSHVDDSNPNEDFWGHVQETIDYWFGRSGGAW